MSIAAKQEELLEELALFQDWTERYEYVISLGKKLQLLHHNLEFGRFQRLGAIR